MNGNRKMVNKLRSLTPDKWGVIEELGNYGVLNELLQKREF